MRPVHGLHPLVGMKWLWLVLLLAPAASYGDASTLINLEQKCYSDCASCPPQLTVCRAQMQNDPAAVSCFNSCMALVTSQPATPDAIIQVNSGAVLTGPGTNCTMVCGNDAYSNGAPGMQKCHPVCSPSASATPVPDAMATVQDAMAKNCKITCTGAGADRRCYQHCDTPANSRAGFDPYNWTSKQGARNVLVNDPSATTPTLDQDGHTVVTKNGKQIQLDVQAANQLSKALDAQVSSAPEPVSTYVPNDNWVEAPLPTVAPDF